MRRCLIFKLRSASPNSFMELKIISLNIWLGGTLFDSALQFLRKENPDIIGLQEVYNNKTFDLLKSELGYDYASFAPAISEKIGEEKIELGNAILSRFPITAEKTIFYDVPYDGNFVRPDADFSRIPRNLQRAVLEINGVKLNVFNTQGIWGFDGKDTERRLQMGKTIINEIKDKENVILTGDFNVNQGTKTIANIGKHLKEIFKDELINTFNLKRKPKPSGYDTAVVDRIFVSKNIKVLEHYCPQVDVSDHLPLVCVLEI